MTHRTALACLASLALLLWTSVSCKTAADDDFHFGGDDDAGDDDTGDDDTTPADDDDSADDDSADDDDSAGDDDSADDDDSAGDDDDTTAAATIAGVVRPGTEEIGTPPPWEVGVALFGPGDFDPTDGPLAAPLIMEIGSAASMPYAYELEPVGGGAVWVVGFLDRNGNGLQVGPDAGDLSGFYASPVTPPATNIDIELDYVVE